MSGSGIYKIQSIGRPERCYIGSAVNIRKRWINHLSLLRRNAHHSIKLQNHYNKYGEDDLTFSIVELCLPDFLTAIEDKYFHPLPWFNIHPSARSARGVKRRPESIDKMRRAKTGKKMTEDQRLRMIASVTGIKRTEETKQRMSAWQKGKKKGPMPDAIRQKMSESHKGTTKPFDVRRKMSESGKRAWITRKLNQAS